MFRAHVLETCIVKQILYIKLVKYWDKYTQMHGQQNVIKWIQLVVDVYQKGDFATRKGDVKFCKIWEIYLVAKKIVCVSWQTMLHWDL